jgi:hypothetical protein
MKFHPLILIFFISLGCGKPDVIHRYLRDYEKSFVFFKPGTYWIYQNDSTLAVDSLYVTSIIDYTNSLWADGDIYLTYEKKGCMINRSLNQQNTISLYASPTNEYTVSGEIFFDSWDAYAYFTFENGEMINALKHNTLNLNGYLYNDAFEVININSFQADTVKAFLVSNLGVLKWEAHYPDSIHDNWSLLRYHIQQ